MVTANVTEVFDMLKEFAEAHPEDITVSGTPDPSLGNEYTPESTDTVAVFTYVENEDTVILEFDPVAVDGTRKSYFYGFTKTSKGTNLILNALINGSKV